jgi:hypothetical protein
VTRRKDDSDVADFDRLGPPATYTPSAGFGPPLGNAPEEEDMALMPLDLNVSRRVADPEHL